MANSKPIRIGYVPEHYLLPLHLAKADFTVPVELVPFPQGTGHMITSLSESSIDIAIGLTEGWIAGLLKSPSATTTPPYHLVGSWVSNPLRWSVITGRDRTEINSVGDLKKNAKKRAQATATQGTTSDEGKIKVGVSRLGSGSHIMSFVLGEEQNWLGGTSSSSSSPPNKGNDEGAGPGVGTGEGADAATLEFVPLGALAGLIEGVSGTNKDASPPADFFMWEHFTTKPYFHSDPSSNNNNDTSENHQQQQQQQQQQQPPRPSPPLKWIGEIYTPWPSWHIVASTSTFPSTSTSTPASTTATHPTVRSILSTLQSGIAKFNADPSAAIALLSDPSKPAGCFYTPEDAREWLKNVRFADDTTGVDGEMVGAVVDVLKKVGVVGKDVVWDQGMADKLGDFRF